MAAPAPRLTRSSAAMQPKVSPAVAFLSSTPVVEDDEDSETDESFDPTLDDSFLSDDEPDAVITSEQVNPNTLKSKLTCACKRAQPAPLEPAEQQAFERRAAELEQAYAAALAAAADRPSPSRSNAASSEPADEDNGTLAVEDEPTVVDVSRQVDSLVVQDLTASSFTPIGQLCVASYSADWLSASLAALSTSSIPASTLTLTNSAISFLRPPARGWLHASASTGRLPVAAAYVEI